MMPRQVVSRPAAGRGRAGLEPESVGEGRRRVVIGDVRPRVDGGGEAGEFPIKRAVGERVRVEAVIFADGHDAIAADLLYRPEADARQGWRRVRLEADVNDRWLGSFEATSIGRWEYSLEAWIDRFGTWREGLEKKVEAGVGVDVELLEGAALVADAALEAEAARGEGRGGERAGAGEADELRAFARRLRGSPGEDGENDERIGAGLSERLAALMRAHAPRRFVTSLERPLRMVVDRRKALYSTWYELFPRSCSDEPGRHGTFDDVIARLPYVASMGFDVMYLPPIHPIGRTHRKGRNNAPTAAAGDPGSPWAIGSAEGGHTAVHPRLGTLADFDRLVAAAGAAGVEIALDVAFQCSPDHPWVREHPGWFRRRADGSIQYAENPPKKYEDIYPLDFETEDWEGLWSALKGVFDFWIEHGVRIFRVDNPHTKAFGFWDWLIGEVAREHPDVLLLSEAFTRPARMVRLAKGGFSQSYTYFAWRNGPEDLTEYMTELTRTDVAQYFRPNFWPNTPDILTAYLQDGGRPGAMARLVLAATLSASYGIYGPVFELCDFSPREAGSEENLDSEKYQVRHWGSLLDAPWSLRHFIARVNRIRREHPALQQNRLLDFHRVSNQALVAYSKRTADFGDVILCVVSTNPFEDHWGTVQLDLRALGIDHLDEFDAVDLLAGRRYRWRGPDNIVGLGPTRGMAHILHIRRSPSARNESDFEYFA